MMTDRGAERPLRLNPGVETSGRRPEQESPPGRLSRSFRWSKENAARASAWALGARESHASVDVGFRLAHRDQRVAAGVLAGGIAYRFFFWILSISVLTTGVLGFVNESWLETGLHQRGRRPDRHQGGR